MDVTFFSVQEFEKPFIQQEEQAQLSVTLCHSFLNESTVGEVPLGQAVVVFATDAVTAPVVEQLHQKEVRFIATRSRGFDHIDLSKAKELGIKVAHVPTYSPYSVAEHAVALMLSLNRHLPQAFARLRNYNFSLAGLVGFDMHGKTVGVVGAGDTGAALVHILHGFGCRILIYDIKENEALKQSCNASYVSLEELCRTSDIISLHVPLNEQTRHLINKDRIDQMKHGVMLINVARGAVLNTEDALQGLNSGKIGYLGLDVYEKEKRLFFTDHSGERDQVDDPLLNELLQHERAFVTGHQAFLTQEAVHQFICTTFESLRAWQQGRAAQHEL